MNMSSVSDNRPESTDALYDTSPRHLAAQFGLKAIEHLRAGRDPVFAARLAASFAFKAEPSLRLRVVE